VSKKVFIYILVCLSLLIPLDAFGLPTGQNSFQPKTASAQEALIPPSTGGQPADSPGQGRDIEPHPNYLQAIQNTAAMVWDQQAQQLAAQYDLQILNLTWEDTGRYYNSSVGPNISDVTIQVQHQNPTTGQYELDLMPVIRYPNFSDLSADISPDRFFLLVGNQKGEEPHKITLRDYLRDFPRYLSDPDSFTGRRTSLLASRDSHILVSAQAAFLPVPEKGKAEFNPVIFNYQSYQGDPAILVIVATREGTSATVIDNVRDAFPSGFSWGQRLFFNQNGERASFTGERFSDYLEGEQGTARSAPEAAGESGLNMVLLIQVPLKQKHPMQGLPGIAEESVMAAPMMQEKSDVEAAVIGHGPVEGPFTEVDGLDIERDARFPVRVTVQFYKATSDGVVSSADMQEIASQIRRVYDDADYVGSLVVGGPSERPTEYDGPKDEPAGWWQVFWKRFEDNTGLTSRQALDLLRSLKAYAGRWIP
jgi:hypothetical protein